MKTEAIKSWAIDRLSENSTYRGLIALAAACGIQIAPDLQAALLSLALALIGLINVIRKSPA
ncbi:MAG: hypothetical protein LLG01_17220 [Planctomycetaceae bacterium]|nr:hypothetical protein [Planctomycetaceae bacterium]